MLKCIRPHSDARHFRSRFAFIRPGVSLVVAVVALGIGATRADAQSAAQSVMLRDADLLATAGSHPVATVRKGATVAVSAARGAYVEAAVDGWIAAALLGAAHDSFPLTVKPGASVHLRATPAATSAIVADLRGGMGLNEIERQGAWVHVRRTGWMPSKFVGAASVANGQSAAAAASPPAAAVTASATVQPTVHPGADVAPDSTRNGFVLTPTVQTSMTASPGGERIGTLGAGARATVTGRERGWVRVQVEGWVREADLSVADTALRGALSAADLRADPDATVGRLVHWEVEVLAHQIADPLRKGLSDQEPYLLAQGPSGENALLYLAIPPALAATAREIPDLGKAIITARVRSGRSEPVGIPVLELLTIVGR